MSEYLDDIDSLEYSFLEQTDIQIRRLKEQIDREPKVLYTDDHRLFDYNPFDEIPSYKREELDSTIIELLDTLGSSLYSEQLALVVDRKKPDNFFHDERGVVRLKRGSEIIMSGCKSRKQNLILHVVAKMRNLIQQNGYMSLRELYYHSQEMCQRSPRKLSRCVDDICCLLGCSRVHLRIVSQPKGIVYGPLKFKLKSGEVFDCLSSREGTGLPTPQSPIIEISSNANFVMILEKDSVLQRILNQEPTTNFIEKYKVILFTARGYPDINSRAFLNFLWSRLQIPMLALTDADPHGMEIVCCYKFGCQPAASEATHLALPHLRWLGLLPSDVERHCLPKSVTMRLSPDDMRKLKSLYKRPYLQTRPGWIYQLNTMANLKRKAELEAIDDEGGYLVQKYLPHKLRYASWLA